MDSQTQALIRRYLTGAAVAALGGALGALTTMLDGGVIPSVKALGLAMAAGAVLALRLWLSRQGAGLASIIGLERSLGDQLAAPPAEGPDEGGILYRAMLPSVPDAGPRTAALGLVGAPIPAPSFVEVRRFSDARLQEAVEHVFESTGGKSGMFFNVNIDGEIRSGIAVRVGGHLSVGGFLVKKPGLKLEGLAAATFVF